VDLLLVSIEGNPNAEAAAVTLSVPVYRLTIDPSTAAVTLKWVSGPGPKEVSPPSLPPSLQNIVVLLMMSLFFPLMLRRSIICHLHHSYLLPSLPPSFQLPAPASSLPPPPPPSQPVMYMHTSGTTSRPKRVRLTHGNLASSLANIQVRREGGREGREGGREGGGGLDRRLRILSFFCIPAYFSHL